MIADFSRNGTDPDRGNTGPFWLGSALAIVSATVTFFFIKPLSHDGMVKEDENVSLLSSMDILSRFRPLP